MSERIAHSAEHAFIGALQKILGRTLEVRKVEHGEKKNTAFIVENQLSLDVVLHAEQIVNSLIIKGARITERDFGSLDEARKTIPSLRANEKRIAGPVRVIEIEGHDHAACSMEHVCNLKECDFFLVTGFTKSGNETQVDFVVSGEARDEARRISSILLTVCTELGANLNTVDNSVKKLRTECQIFETKLKALTEELLGRLEKEDLGSAILHAGSFENLDDKQVLESVGQFIKREPSVAVIANSFGDRARVVLARSDGIANLDLNTVLKRCPVSVKGGGRPNFVTGIIEARNAVKFVESVVDAIKNSLRVG